MTTRRQQLVIGVTAVLSLAATGLFIRSVWPFIVERWRIARIDSLPLAEASHRTARLPGKRAGLRRVRPFYPQSSGCPDAPWVPGPIRLSLSPAGPPECCWLHA